MCAAMAAPRARPTLDANQVMCAMQNGSDDKWAHAERSFWFAPIRGAKHRLWKMTIKSGRKLMSSDIILLFRHAFLRSPWNPSERNLSPVWNGMNWGRGFFGGSSRSAMNDWKWSKFMAHAICVCAPISARKTIRMNATNVLFLWIQLISRSPTREWGRSSFSLIKWWPTCLSLSLRVRRKMILSISFDLR